MKKKRKRVLYTRRSMAEKLILSGYYLLADIIKTWRMPYRPFKEFGITVYEGRQSAGKTLSMVAHAYELKQRYPDMLIYSNFKVDFADGMIESLDDIMEIRNGDKGVLFMIDEIGQLFDSYMTGKELKNMNGNLLQELTQQRKQRIAIWGSSQQFLMLHKAFRRQTFKVCRNFNVFGRTFFNIYYDAQQYELMADRAADSGTRQKVKRLGRKWFVATNELFSRYDTYEKITRLDGMKK